MSLRYIIRLIQAFFKRFKAIIIIGIIVGILFFLIIFLLIPTIDSTSDRIGIVGRYTIDDLPDEISKKISTGLTRVDATGNVEPAIAKSWESPDNGKTWIFKINNDLLWHDKKPVLAKDLVYEFSDATYEIVDNETVKFTLQSNFAAFPIILSKPMFKKGLAGVGEWSVKKVSLSGGYVQKIELRDKESNKITYKFYPSEDRLKLTFKLGQVDTMNNLQIVDDFLNWKTVDVAKTVNNNNFVGLFYNTEDEKLADKSIRQALSYAIDKTNFDGDRAISPISPDSWGYNPLVKPYERDLEKAKDAKDFKVVLSTLPNLLKTAEKIKKDWEEAGIVCEVQVVTDIPENFQVFLATVDIPKDPDQYSLWHSTQTTTNISNFKNARIDKLLEDGRTELDQETRKKIYLDFQRFLVEDVPTTFLYHPNLYSVTRK